MCKGYVYILTNESMPGLVKIGRSKHGGRSRAKDMYSQATGVPTPFKMSFEIWSEDCIELENTVHDALHQSRVSEYREFFRVDEEYAIEVVMNAYGAEHNIHAGMADFIIQEDTLMTSYGLSVDKFAESYFGGVPLCAVLSLAIGYHLTEDAVKEAITAYFEERQERGRKLYAVPTNEEESVGGKV